MKFRKNGSIIAIDLGKRVKSKKRNEAEKELVKVIAENVSISTRKSATALGVSLNKFHDDLSFKSYQFHD